MLQPTIYIPSHAMKLQADELRQTPLQKAPMRVVRGQAQGPFKCFSRLRGAPQFPAELAARRVG
jgi:hypothetical protein